MARKKFEDDGRTIANMNVEGMRWYRPDGDDRNAESVKSSPEPVSRKDARAAVWGALGASMLIVLVFAAVFGAFLLFCDKIWFK